MNANEASRNTMKNWAVSIVLWKKTNETPTNVQIDTGLRSAIIPAKSDTEAIEILIGELQKRGDLDGYEICNKIAIPCN